MDARNQHYILVYPHFTESEGLVMIFGEENSEVKAMRRTIWAGAITCKQGRCETVVHPVEDSIFAPQLHATKLALRSCSNTFRRPLLLPL